MRKDLTSSIVAIVVCTVVLGLAYPLLTTGVAQLVFPNRSDGSQVKRDGKVVGSKLIGQDFRRNPDYFQERPSQTKYAANATGFLNQGPNQKDLADIVKKQIADYLALERPYTPGLRVSGIPVDAVTNSASGVDPQISQANARIQAHRIAARRHAPLGRIRKLIDDHTDGRFLGFLGEPGVNVLELNLALDREFPNR
jgi:potassium-transporting ATPase KdpC subunit